MQRCAFVLFLGISACGSVIDVGAGDKSNGNGSSTNPTAVGAPTALDGVWDITSGENFASAEMTITGASAHGAMIDRSEGTYTELRDSSQSSPSKCLIERSRVELSFTASGNSFSATRQYLRQYKGDGCPEGPRISGAFTMTGVRTRAMPDGITALNGEWQVTGRDFQFDGTLNENALSGKRVSSKDGRIDSINIAVAGNLFTVSSSDSLISVAARKRE
jgi:hypothetical protein